MNSNNSNKPTNFKRRYIQQDIRFFTLSQQSINSTRTPSPSRHPLITMPPPINSINNNQSTNKAIMNSSSSMPQKRSSNSILDDFYQKTNKARAIAPKTGNSPLFKPLVPTNVSSNYRNNLSTSRSASTALNTTLANVPAANKESAQRPSTAGMKIVTGTIENIFKVKKSLPNMEALFEIYAKVISIRDGKSIGEKLLLLRNESGPVLQAVYYEIDFCLPPVATGCLVRIVGRMIGVNRLQIFKLKEIYEYPTKIITRLQTLSTFVLDNEKESRL